MTTESAKKKFENSFLKLDFIASIAPKLYRLDHGNSSNHNGRRLEDVWVELFGCPESMIDEVRENYKKFSKPFVSWAHKNDLHLPEIVICHEREMTFLKFVVVIRKTF